MICGKYYTMTPNKRTGDRSYCTEIMQCLRFNATHVQMEHPSYGPIILVLSEHDFTEWSEDMMEARK